MHGLFGFAKSGDGGASRWANFDIMWVRWVRRFAILVAAIWLLTLGIHIEQSADSLPCVDRPGFAWSDFESGVCPLHVNAFLETPNSYTSGIPYVLSRSSDLPPYRIHFVVAVPDGPIPDRVSILTVQITEDDGEQYTVVGEAMNVAGDFSRDSRGEERGETVFYRANIPIPNALHSRSSCSIRIQGIIFFDDGQTSFERTIRLPFERKTNVYPGWIRLMLP